MYTWIDPIWFGFGFDWKSRVMVVMGSHYIHSAAAAHTHTHIHYRHSGLVKMGTFIRETERCSDRKSKID